MRGLLCPRRLPRLVREWVLVIRQLFASDYLKKSRSLLWSAFLECYTRYMPDEKIPFTRQAYEQMQSRFTELKIKREEVLIRLKEAREMGDLSENGAYQYAKFELGNIGRELRRLRQLLRDGEIVERKASDGIGFGHTVTLKGPKTLTFMLVSEHESDPVKGKLSLQSPIGQAVIGKKAGETVRVETPAGKISYVIEKVA